MSRSVNASSKRTTTTSPPASAAPPTPTTPTRDDAPFFRPISAIYADLAAPLKPRHVKTKKVKTKRGKDYEADYVHHTTIRDALDHYAPGWSWTERPYLMDGKVYVVGALTLRGLDHTGRVVEVTRESIGNEDADLDGYGDPSSNASAQALRRAAMGHGYGRKLWRKSHDQTNGWHCTRVPSAEMPLASPRSEPGSRGSAVALPPTHITG